MSPDAYLDHNATSPLRPEARAAMLAAMDAQANASSVHRAGQAARGLIEDARAAIAQAIGAPDTGIVFTGSGTEACALAILGAVRGMELSQVLVVATEHSAVQDAARASGARVGSVPVGADGVVDLEALEALLMAAGEGVLVAAMAANNETGILQPMADVVELAKQHGALVFCDAVQAFAKTEFDIGALGIDMAAVSAHKLGGPQGVGALYAGPGVRLAPMIPGRQERGHRGGTENGAGIAGLATAAVTAMEQLPAEVARLAALRGRLEAAVLAATPEAVIVGAEVSRLAGTSAIALPGASAETLVIALDLEGIAVSAGAACSSGKVGASHVLEAMGLPMELRSGAIRVSLGWSTTEADIDAFVAAWTRVGRRALERAAA